MADETTRTTAKTGMTTQTRAQALVQAHARGQGSEQGGEGARGAHGDQQRHRAPAVRWGLGVARWAKGFGAMAALCLLALPAHAQETVCARVKIEIKQELTLERQAFDAEMKINNTTDAGVIENVGVEVKVTEEDGTPVDITSAIDSDASSAVSHYLREQRLLSWSSPV